MAAQVDLMCTSTLFDDICMGSCPIISMFMGVSSFFPGYTLILSTIDAAASQGQSSPVALCMVIVMNFFFFSEIQTLLRLMMPASFMDLCVGSTSCP